MLKDELYNIAEQVNIEKEKKRKEYQDELKLRNSSNTNNVWEKYLKKGIIETAQLGDFSRLFRFVKNDRENCYYCVSRQPDTESYFNTKINMPYYYPTIEDSFFDLETLISIIEENGFTYTIKSCPLADSKASKYYTNNAYLRFIIYWGNEVKTTPTTPISSFINNEIELPKVSKTEREKMTAGLRYDILKRDGYKCKICGRSAEDGVKLHVDHIVPIAKGGKTIEENLQTLCQDCNLGKGTKDF